MSNQPLKEDWIYRSLSNPLLDHVPVEKVKQACEWWLENCWVIDRTFKSEELKEKFIEEGTIGESFDVWLFKKAFEPILKGRK